jgi:hypothetical protein
MSRLSKFHKPGQGVGYKPPMDSTIFNWLVTLSSAVIVLAGVLVYTIAHVG